MRVTIEITAPDGATTTRPVTGRLEIGRAGTDVILDDPAISRRHLAVRVDGVAVWAEDLGSSNGSTVDGRPLREPTAVGDGASLRIGDSTIVVRIEAPVASSVQADPGPAAPGGPGGHDTVVRAAPPRDAPADVVTITRGLVEVRFLRGAAGEAAARSVLDTAARARRALAGVGSEAWGQPVTLQLVEPFADPADPERVVTSGTVVDSATGALWMVVTPEAPPEDPHRPLALLFGAALPSAGDVDHLLEGYGLHLSGQPEPPPDVVATLPAAVRDLEPELRTVVAGSFVRYLVAREGDATFRRLLAAPAGRLSETYSKLYGMSETALEMRWRGERSVEESDADTGLFLKMSWKHLRPYRLIQAEVFAWMLLSLAFTAAYPFVTQRLFDTALPSGEFSQVLTLLVVLAGAFAISLLAGLRQSYQSGRIANSVVRDLRASIFSRVQGLQDAWIIRHSQGDVLSRMMNDVARVQAGLTTAIDGGIFQVISLVVSTVIMLRVNVWLGLLVLIGAPIVAVVYRSMSSGARTRSTAVQDDSGALMQVAAENYQANAVVKLFRLAGHEESRFARAADRLFRSQMRMQLFGGIFGVAVNGIVTTLRLLVIGIGAWLVTEGRFTLGGLVAFLGIMGEVLGPVTGLTTLGQSIQSSMGALVRIDEILGAPAESADDLPPIDPLAREITLENVSLSYTAERRALDGVDLQIPAGSRIAFVGPSGSGKSTVLRVLMRLYEPDEGSVRFDGVDVATRSLASMRAQMGVVFQDSFLFDATVRENIAMGKAGASEAEIMAAARAAEVDAFVDRLPRGYDTMVGEGGRHLSGGQRQRVAIARALIADPRILLLDEATSALDPSTERQITETLKSAGAGRTVVAVTHRLTSIADYDRIVVIVDGRIEETGTHTELLALRGVYARLWAEQTGEEPPPAPAFDAGAALARVPLFRALAPEALADVISALTVRVAAAGETFHEGGDRLLLLQSGRADVLARTLSGGLAPVRSVAPGEVFGLGAILGAPTGTVLRMVDTGEVLELSGEAVTSLSQRHPTIVAARSGRATSMAPSGGRQLGSVRSTAYTGTGLVLDVAQVRAAVDAATGGRRG